jgi:SAM-dependent methyltransferase
METLVNPIYFLEPTTREPLTEQQLQLRTLPSGAIDLLFTEQEILSNPDRFQDDAPTDIVGKLKHGAKKFLGKHYSLIQQIFGPTFFRIDWARRQTYFSSKVQDYCKGKTLCLQVGSGSHRVSPELINVDLFPFEEVDLVANCMRLPVKDNSVDVIATHAVLEHLPDGEAFILECFRVLKRGGVIITGAPFIEGFHSSPHDYRRWTRPGLEYIHTHAGFQVTECTPISGPTASLVWIVQEWLAIALSFGSRKLYAMLLIGFSFVFLPLKFLDILLIHYSEADKIGSMYLVIGKKP